ncbi:MAG: M23 family metallopeptidase [Proteobacteria bacterium]|nr:M23 family metallopeptidase [Pseudomonadota bacterium]
MTRRYTRALALLLLALVVATGVAGAEESPPLVRVHERHVGRDVELVVENLVTAEVTVTLRLDVAENVEADREQPRTFVLPGASTATAFRVLLPRDGSRWRYHYLWNVRLGSADAHPDLRAVYRLPFAAGQRFKVLQGFDGTFSHHGAQRYAVDFQMPRGTEVRAARDGEVVYTIDRYTRSAPDPALAPFTNEVIVRHSDGSCAEYVHLQRGGVNVRAGDRVRAGDVLGRSGDVGYASEPHLHFMVFRPIDGIDSESFPMRFDVAESDDPVTPVEGRVYTAR